MCPQTVARLYVSFPINDIWIVVFCLRTVCAKIYTPCALNKTKLTNHSSHNLTISPDFDHILDNAIDLQCIAVTSTRISIPFCDCFNLSDNKQHRRHKSR